MVLYMNGPNEMKKNVQRKRERQNVLRTDDQTLTNMNIFCDFFFFGLQKQSVLDSYLAIFHKVFAL